MITIRVNGRRHDLGDVDPRTPLLWVLRDTLGLTGTKYGCGMAQCGVCTVHIDGEAERDPASSPSARSATPRSRPSRGSPGMTGDHPLQQVAWRARGVPQCGYCQAGQIMNAAALLVRDPRTRPTTTSTPAWPATSAAAAPTSGFAPRFMMPGARGARAPGMPARGGRHERPVLGTRRRPNFRGRRATVTRRAVRRRASSQTRWSLAVRFERGQRDRADDRAGDAQDLPFEPDLFVAIAPGRDW